ncbi:hypothetical protein GGH12_001912 [Coemansia sp. RSA 1822]|nr:hypothetical protein LPJ76_002596 [Coemansia sp. RSA 638]KAJ2123118.1 hypothetical protein IW147_002811 [Coemansia sp. RSA 720]KAJ2544671.1 hypothetical protein GGF49_001021 [Coemansia sp. RSA 1853]KAJ2564591.1 hypothetical protein GGH12_001912 [Coemansia sp. RSA 1822]
MDVKDKRVRVIFRYPYTRPTDFSPPHIHTAHVQLKEQVWRCLLSLPGPDSPHDILAELEHDKVTFDWELLAETLRVPLHDVFDAASSLFREHMGRPLAIDESIQFMPNTGDVASRLHTESTHSVAPVAPSNAGMDSARHTSAHTSGLKAPGSAAPQMDDGASHGSSESGQMDSLARSRDFERTEMRSVESVGDALTPGSPAVELRIATPTSTSQTEPMRRSVEPQLTHRVRTRHIDMRQSMADAMGSQMLPQTRSVPQEPVQRPISSSSSFSDLSNSSLTESAMQDALISEAMGTSTAMSLLGSRMFPWSKKRH